MPRPSTVIPLALLLALIGAVPACDRFGTNTDQPAPLVATKRAHVAPKPGPPFFYSPWTTETQFIVESTVTDLVGMAYYSKHDAAVDPKAVRVQSEEIAASPGAARAYHLRIHAPGQADIDTILPATGSIWAPSLYAGVAARLFGGSQSPWETRWAREAPADPEVRDLTEPTAEVIERENQSVSAGLRGNFLSPEQHERSALLLAALALDENSWRFYDIRSELCRISAHLAAAQALSGGPPATAGGRLASAALCTLYVNQVAALTQLNRIPATDRWVQAWVRALRIRNTGDYRVLRGVAEPTLLERREAFAAQLVAVDPQWANACLPAADSLRSQPDWARIINPYQANAAIDREIFEHSLASEWDAAGRVYRLAEGRDPGDAGLMEALNAEPEPCVTAGPAGGARVRVIGWGHWAGFFQRHICHAILANYRFLQTEMDAPEDALAYRDRADARFGPLRLYPFVRRFNAGTEDYYRRAQDDENLVVRHRPHLVPPAAWVIFASTPSFAAMYCPPPHPFLNEWHRYNPIPGTAYGFEPRTSMPSMINRPDYTAALSKLHAMAPFDVEITRTYLQQITDPSGHVPPDGDAMARAYAPILSFNSNSAVAVARTRGADPDHYEHWLICAAANDPVWNYSLGELYADRGDEARAVRAYERIVFKDGDVDRLSRFCKWMVRTYERKGQSAKATALATRAASSGTEWGLAVMARLLESRGDYPGAVSYCRRIEDNFQEPAWLVGCVLRHQLLTGKPETSPELCQAVQRVLPRGLERIAPGALEAVPLSGVVCRDGNERTMKAGLRPTDVIVGVRGYRVDSFAAYQAVRDLYLNTPFTLTLWREGHYVEISASPPENLFNVEMVDYGPR